MHSKRINTRKMVTVAILIAMQIVFERFVAPINLPSVRLSFTYIPVAVCSILFGPLTGGLAAAAADFLGMMIAPSGVGGYFPGFTLSVFISGASYGFFTKRMGVNIKSITLAVLVSCVGMSMIVNTYWLKIILGKGYFALLPGRVVKSLIMIPIEIVTISMVWKYIGQRIGSLYSLGAES